MGRHALEVSEPRLCVAIDLPPGGREDFELVLEAPVERLVQVVDDSTGEAIANVDVHWRALAPASDCGGGSGRARFDTECERHVIRAVPTVVRLSVWNDDDLPHFDELDLSRAAREHTLRLRRAQGIEVALRSEQTPLAIPDDWEEWPVDPTFEGEILTVGLHDWRRTFTVSAPGVHELVPPRIPGYHELPAQRIGVVAGRRTELVLEYMLEQP